MKFYRLTMWDTTGKNMGTTFDSCIGTIIFANVFVMGIAYWTRIPDNTMFPVTGTAVLVETV